MMRQGAAWLITPGGNAQLLLAANHIRLISPTAPRTDLEPAYVDQRTAAIVAGLRLEGFNALGGNTDADVWHRGLPYIESLDLSSHLQAVAQTPAVDVYAPDFGSQLDALTAAACAPRQHDPDLIGYVSDEGLRWDPVDHPTAVLAFYLSLPLSAEGRQHAADYLRLRYNDDIRGLNRAWGVRDKDFTTVAAPGNAARNPGFLRDAAPFGEQVLVRYVQAAANSIHAADPNHLYLGANLSLDPAWPPAAGSDAALVWGIPDVATVRLAPGMDAMALLKTAGALTSKPLLLSIEGCTAQPSLSTMFRTPGLIGYIWTPDTDWQSGACAAEAQAVWRPLNLAAAEQH